MKKFKIVGGVVLGIAILNAAVTLYFDLPRHINDIIAEEDAHPDQPRKGIHQTLVLAFERAFDEKYGPA